MLNQEKNCYLGINGKKADPVSEADIQKLYDHNKITGDTKFARAGDTEWTTVSKVGIFTPPLPKADELPPLPVENTPTNSTAQGQKKTEQQPIKKSKLGFVAAGLGVAVVAVVVFVVVLIGNMGNAPVIPADTNIAQGNPSLPTPSPEGSTTVANNPNDTALTENRAMEFSTFRVPNSNIIFDYPSHFIYEQTNSAENDAFVSTFVFRDMSVGANDLRPLIAFHFTRTVLIEDNLLLLDNVNINTLPGMDTGITGRETEFAADGKLYELLNILETENGFGFYHLINSSSGGEVWAEYRNHGFTDADGNVRLVNMAITVPFDYVEDFSKFFNTVFGSLRYSDFGNETNEISIADDTEFSTHDLGASINEQDFVPVHWMGSSTSYVMEHFWLPLEQPNAWTLENEGNIRFSIWNDVVYRAEIYNPDITVSGIAWDITAEEIHRRFDVLYEDWGMHHAIGIRLRWDIITFYIDTDIAEFISIRESDYDDWLIDENQQDSFTNEVQQEIAVSGDMRRDPDFGNNALIRPVAWDNMMRYFEQAEALLNQSGDNEFIRLQNAQRLYSVPILGIRQAIIGHGISVWDVPLYEYAWDMFNYAGSRLPSHLRVSPP